MERKNKTWEKWGKERKRRAKEKKTHTEGGGENGYLIFLLSVGDKREILKFTFNRINCLIKHSNLPC